MPTEFSAANQANLQHCPYLALINDIKTNSDFPSDFNYCHRCKQPEIPTYLHQQEVCLTQYFTECIMLRNTHLKRLPKDIRLLAPAANKAKLLPLFAAIIALGAASIYLFSSGFLNFRILAPSSTPPFVATTPSPTSKGLLMVSDFTPTFNAPPSAASTPSPTETAKATPSDTGTPTSTQILSQFCSVYDIRYYSMAFLGGGTVQLVYDTQMDLSAYRRRDANGNSTPQLDLPGLIVWINQSQYTEFNAFLRSPNFPNLLYVEIIARENDHVALEIIAGDNYRCSREIILPAESIFFTPTKFMNTSTPTPTNTHSPTTIITQTFTSSPTNTNTPTE